jgi:hypothetical protein
MRFVVSTEFHEVGIDVDTMAASENGHRGAVRRHPGGPLKQTNLQKLFDRERNRDEKRTPTY